MYMSTGVEGDRSLMTCAISTPVIPGIELSVMMTSWILGSNNARASVGLRAECTAYPKLLRNHFVVRRLSSWSSTNRIVLRPDEVGFSTRICDSVIATMHRQAGAIKARRTGLYRLIANRNCCPTMGSYFSHAKTYRRRKDRRHNSQTSGLQTTRARVS